MDFKLKDMYSYLLSHTFPGLFFGIEILLIMKWFAHIDIFGMLQVSLSKPENTGPIIAIMISAYAFSTLLGFVLDGIHHFVYEDFLRAESDDDIFCAVNNMERMYIYQHFVEDDYWYPYEAYANISIAMVPGLFLLPYKLINLKVDTWFLIALSLSYVFVLFVMIYEARSTLRRCAEREKQIIKSLNNASNSVE